MNRSEYIANRQLKRHAIPCATMREDSAPIQPAFSNSIATAADRIRMIAVVRIAQRDAIHAKRAANRCNSTAPLKTWGELIALAACVAIMLAAVAVAGVIA